MGKQVSNALDLVSSFLESARAEKVAELKKKAYDPSEPTSHPVMKQDDGTQKATTGSRAAENNSDVKKDYGSAGNTGQEDANSASSDKQNIGTQKMDSSESKGNVADPKATKDKPDESSGHPSNSTFSEKYSSLQKIGEQIALQLTELTKTAAKKGKPAEASVETKKVEAPAAPEVTKEAELKLAAAKKYSEDAEAGYLAAEQLAKTLGFDKSASEAEAVISQTIDGIVKSAEADAQLFGEYMLGHMEGVKRANEQRTKKAEGLPPEMLGSGAEGGPMTDAAPAGGPEMGAGDAMGGMGAGAGPEMGGPGGPEMGGGSEDEIIEALAQALEEAGISPEELVQAIQAEQGGGGMGGGAMGGGPDMGAGPGPEAAPAPAAPSEAPKEKSEAPKERSEGKEAPKEEKKEEPKEAQHRASVKVAVEAVKALTTQARTTKMASTLRALAKKK